MYIVYTGVNSLQVYAAVPFDFSVLHLSEGCYLSSCLTYFIKSKLLVVCNVKFTTVWLLIYIISVVLLLIPVCCVH